MENSPHTLVPHVVSITVSSSDLTKNFCLLFLMSLRMKPFISVQVHGEFNMINDFVTNSNIPRHIPAIKIVCSISIRFIGFCQKGQLKIYFVRYLEPADLSSNV
ncbi:hypothetical protein RF11_02722 [Thelohanellus kitauei]|uniref:Uncharacterized protein n=1 Tax=Thelohanellus kitauei TaxID=669202 RepID=A0A0C2MUE2_THEKT|nr:hypothetical protein RF11_02722 [Thelohanellus kitauei]